MNKSKYSSDGAHMHHIIKHILQNLFFHWS